MKNEDANAIASPKLSGASKMPCKSWSLPAWETCPGAADDNGEPVDACKGCYALQNRYLFGAVKALRDHNLDDWEKKGWVAAMVKAIGKGKKFRWFDSGDVYTAALASKIYDVMYLTPECKHWLPTRAYKFDNVLVWLERMEKLPNVVVRYSSDSVHGETLEQFDNSSVIIQSQDDFKAQSGHVMCRAFERQGKCGNCTACWEDKIKVVSYIKHGREVKAEKFKGMKAWLAPVLETTV